jgi:hypothetical protein
MRTQSAEVGDWPKKGSCLVDIAALESYGNETRLVFWEAKHYSNGELRAEDGRAPPVLRQLGFYERYLSENRKAIEGSYTRMAKNLVSIGNMGWKRQLSPLIADVATGKVLTLGTEPAVGLVIFGFGRADQVRAGWKTQLELLKSKITHVRAAGDANNICLST